jgi:hypothetical protein
MKRLPLVIGVAGIASLVTGVLIAQNSGPEPTCRMCPATYIDSSEIDAYVKKAMAEKLTDQQIRDVEIGKAHIGVGVVHRPRLTAPPANAVAEHDLVSEVYHVMSGSATLVTGPEMEGMERRPATNTNVRMLNGPGHNAKSVRDGVTHQLKAGDVIVIPAGTGHWFTKIDDHITYLMIRVDPDKVAPLKDEAASKADLAGKK